MYLFSLCHLYICLTHCGKKGGKRFWQIGLNLHVQQKLIALTLVGYEKFDL